MDLKDAKNSDPNYEEILVFFNASPDSVTFKEPGFMGKAFELHSVQQASADARVRESKYDLASGTFTVPGRTTVVFNLLDQPIAEPTPTAIQAAPAITDPNVILTLAGVIGAFVAVVVMMFALRPKRTK